MLFRVETLLLFYTNHNINILSKKSSEILEKFLLIPEKLLLVSILCMNVILF